MKDFTIQITTKGKVGITYPEKSNYNVVLEQLKPYLVKAESTSAKIVSRKEISKPKKKISTERPSKMGFWEYQLEKRKYEDEKKNKQKVELEAKISVLREQMEMRRRGEGRMTRLEEAKRRLKYREIHGKGRTGS